MTQQPPPSTVRRPAPAGSIPTVPQPRARAPIDAILLVSFGGPEGPDEVLPFLERVTSGRGIPAQRLAEVARHYEALGGVSPLNAHTRSLLQALRDEVSRRGSALPVHLGNRNSAPYLADALREIHGAGGRDVVAVTTSAYSSYSSCRQYREDLGAALEETGLAAELRVEKVRPYADRPGFLAPAARGLAESLDELSRDGVPGDRIRVLFTTHSIPDVMALASGPDPAATVEESRYVRQHLAAAARVVALVPAMAERDVAWSLAFQSRSGPPAVPWLGPDVNDAVRAAAAEGALAVVLVPIGFVSDHMEVVWDLDHEVRRTAAALGVRCLRVGTPGSAEEFVSALVDLVEEAQGLRSLPHDEPWARLCSASCCAYAGSRRPAVPGC